MGMFTPGSEIISGLLRGKPNLPAFNKIDPQQAQTTAIAGNEASMPALEKIAGQISGFNRDQLTSMLNAAIPGYDSLVKGTTDAIGSEVRGEIPTDVSDAVQRSAAARSMGGGFGGSRMGNALTARDLGLTSLDLTQKGISSAQSWIGTMAQIFKPTNFDMTSMFLTPQQQFGMATEERDKQFQHDWTGAQIDWQSSLGYLAANEIETDSSQFNSMASSVVGKVAGGAAGGGGM